MQVTGRGAITPSVPWPEPRRCLGGGGGTMEGCQNTQTPAGSQHRQNMEECSGGGHGGGRWRCEHPHNTAKVPLSKIPKPTIAYVGPSNELATPQTGPMKLCNKLTSSGFTSDPPALLALINQNNSSNSSAVMFEEGQVSTIGLLYKTSH